MTVSVGLPNDKGVWRHAYLGNLGPKISAFLMQRDPLRDISHIVSEYRHCVPMAVGVNHGKRVE